MEKTLGEIGNINLTNIINRKDTLFKLQAIADALEMTIHHAEIVVRAQGYSLIMERDTLFVMDRP